MRLMRLLDVLGERAETDETFHWESGVRYQHSSHRLDPKPDQALLFARKRWALKPA